MAAQAPTPPSTPTQGAGAAHARAQPWVRGPAWDGFWILNGLWLAPLLWWLAGDATDPFASPADNVYLVITLLFWIGHRIGSSYLAYCTTAYRSLLREQPIRFVILPIVVAFAVFLYVLLPERVIPIDRFTRVFWLAVVDYVFVSYHFAAQHYGVMSLYRVRGQEPRSAGTRRIDRLYALGIGGLVVIGAEVIVGRVARQGEWLDPILSGWWDPDPYHAWWQVYETPLFWIGRSLVALAAILMLVGAFRRRNLPRALYVLSVAAMVWMAFQVSPLLFVMVWTANHWMVATGLASRVASGDPEPDTSRWYRFWHAVNRRPAAVVGVLALVSVLLVAPMEVEAASEDEPSYAMRFVPSVMHWLTQAEIVPWLVALGFTTGFVHYLLDRAVYRLSDPAVRKAAAGLLEKPRR